MLLQAEAELMPESLTCVSCRHWHKLPRPAAGLGAVDLSQPALGECREQLRVLVGQGPEGPVLRPYYVALPEGWHACGQHRSREVLGLKAKGVD